jgi:hypothetical protein
MAIPPSPDSFQPDGPSRLEFSALSLIAEISAALAGFATLAGVVRHDELDADGIFAIVLNCLIAMLFALVAILLVGPTGIGSQALRPPLGGTSTRFGSGPMA